MSDHKPSRKELGSASKPAARKTKLWGKGKRSKRNMSARRGHAASIGKFEPGLEPLPKR